MTHKQSLLGVNSLNFASMDLIFELMECDMTSFMIHRKLFENDVVHLSRQLLQGLAYLAASGIVHRDIKPQNLLLTSGGIAGAVAVNRVEDYTVRRKLNTYSYKTHSTHENTFPANHAFC